MKRALPILAAAAGLALLASCAPSGGAATGWTGEVLAPQTTANDPYGTAYVTAAETEDLLLTYNPDTTHIRLTVKETGCVWSTDQRTAGDTGVYPLFSLTYRDAGGEVGYMEAGEHAVSKGQYRIEPVEGGLKVQYTLGTVMQQFRYPQALSPSRYQRFYARGNDEQKSLMEMVYRQVIFAEYDEGTAAELQAQYPQAEEGEVYALRSPTMNDALKTEITQLFEAVGYTEEDAALDGGGDKPQGGSDSPLFHLTLWYLLDGDSLVVRVPQETIGMSAGVWLEELSLLECFKGGEARDGYFLLPDGSGSIMEYGNGRGGSGPYRVPIYGYDKSLSSENDILDLYQAPLNVYGCREGQNAYLAVIEDSEARAVVNAVPGSAALTPRVWPSFTLYPVDYMTSASQYAIQDDQKMAVHPLRRYDGDIRLRYLFLTGEEADYSGMAARLRAYWFAETGPAPAGKDAGYPLSVEMIGMIRAEKTRLGIPYTVDRVLTSFSQAAQMAGDLLDLGVDRLDVIYSGWSNGGYLHSGLYRRAAAEKCLGGAGGLEALETELAARGAALYPELDIQYDYTGDTPRRYAAAAVSGVPAALYRYSPAVFRQADTLGYILSPASVTAALDNGLRYLRERGIPRLALRSAGRDVNADYREEGVIDRQEAVQHLRDDLARAKAGGASLLVSRGNAYTLPYADRLVDMPLHSDRYTVTDYSVPFLAMVLSGQVPYASPPLNLSGGEPADLLRILENGAAPYVVLTAQAGELKETGLYPNLYATAFSSQQETVKKAYAYLKDGIGSFYGHAIQRHQRLAPDVYKTTFDNGWIVVNYNREAVTLEGLTIPGLSYRKGG